MDPRVGQYLQSDDKGTLCGGTANCDPGNKSVPRPTSTYAIQNYEVGNDTQVSNGILFIWIAGRAKFYVLNASISKM